MPPLPDVTGDDRRVTRRAPETPATQELDRLRVSYTPRTYAHDPATAEYGLEAASKLGAPPEQVFKTLVVEADGRLAVAVVPVAARVDLKSLAAALGAKRAAMAAPDLAERRTGYVVGGISPFGQRTRLPLVLDASAEGFASILVSGGRRGFDLEVAPQDLLTATAGSLAAIAVPR